MDIETLLTRGVENIYPTPKFLEDKVKKGKVSLYLGIDPTGPHLHLGHAIPLMKLRQFQQLGHKVILLMGDFTGMIGDPTDKSATRKQLTPEQVKENLKGYKKQASKILDFDGDNPVEIKFNSEWLGKMSFKDVVELSANFTVQQMLARDMFENRIKEGKPIGLHEFLYPLMQGYDCVAMDVDGEVGGSDQMFNMLAGRTLMKALKDKEKFVVTTKLLADPTGVKMGKTTGNMITLDDSPKEMFGKVMSWTDGMIAGGFELCTEVPMEEIAKIEKEMKEGANPRDFKVRLAREIITFYYSEDEAKKSEEEFVEMFTKGGTPDDIEEFKIQNSKLNIVDLLVNSKLVSSKSEGRRMVEQGGVKIDGEKVDSIESEIEGKDGMVIQVGKRKFVKLVS
jgi:tyrosyl-tRNA synthetase